MVVMEGTGPGMRAGGGWWRRSGGWWWDLDQPGQRSGRRWKLRSCRPSSPLLCIYLYLARLLAAAAACPLLGLRAHAAHPWLLADACWGSAWGAGGWARLSRATGFGLNSPFPLEILAWLIERAGAERRGLLGGEMA